MKGTDYCIVFVLLCLTFVLPFELRLSMLSKLQMQKAVYNNIFDTAAMDALTHSYTRLDSIDAQKAYLFFFREVRETLMVEEGDFPIVLVTDAAGFQVCAYGQWNKVDCIGKSREQKIVMLREVLEDALQTTVSIPYIEAEEWYNTIGDNGMLVVYRSQKKLCRVFQSDYENIIVSAAAVRKR